MHALVDFCTRTRAHTRLILMRQSDINSLKVLLLSRRRTAGALEDEDKMSMSDTTLEEEEGEK